MSIYSLIWRLRQKDQSSHVSRTACMAASVFKKRGTGLVLAPVYNLSYLGGSKLKASLDIPVRPYLKILNKKRLVL